MTSDDINAEIGDRIANLLMFGNVTVVFGSRDKEYTAITRMRTTGAVPLDFTVCTDPDEEYIVFINRIGDTAILDNMPRTAVTNVQRLPEAAFVEGDKFHEEYHTLPRAVTNYSVYTEISQLLRPKSIFEIGVRAGYSAWMMLAGSPTALYRGLDLDNGRDGGRIGYPEHARKMLPEQFPEADIRVVHGDSQVLEALPRRYDLIHVDGSHGHDQALHDLEVCAPYADYLLTDDVTHISTVGSAVTEFLQNHPTVQATLFETWRGHVLMRTAEVKSTRGNNISEPEWFTELA